MVEEIVASGEDSAIYDLFKTEYKPKTVRVDEWNTAIKEVKKKLLGAKLRTIGSDIGFVYASGMTELSNDVYRECQVHDRSYIPRLEEQSAVYGVTHRLRAAVIVPVFSAMGNGDNTPGAVLAVYSPYPRIFSQLDVEVANRYADVLGLLLPPQWFTP